MDADNAISGLAIAIGLYQMVRSLLEKDKLTIESRDGLLLSADRIGALAHRQGSERVELGGSIYCPRSDCKLVPPIHNLPPRRETPSSGLDAMKPTIWSN